MDTGSMFVAPPKVEQPIDIFVTTHILADWDLSEQIEKLQLTSRCITAIYRNTVAPFYLIIADDSTDQLSPIYFAELQKKHDNITFIHSDKPYKTGNQLFNIGLKQTKSPFMTTVSSSTIVEPDWEIVAINLFKDDPKIGVVGLKCLLPNGQIESAGITMVKYTPVDIGRDLSGHRQTALYECPAVQWAFAIVRKEAVGILEEDVYNGFKGWDDIDNCFMLRKNGWKVMYCGYGLGYHFPRATRGSDTLESHLRNRENARAFYKRWGYWKQFEKEFPKWKREEIAIERQIQKEGRNQRT